MKSDLIGSLVTILVAVIGVATIAVLVSRNANTAGVIKEGSSGFAKILSTAISPVSGNVGLIG